MKQRVAVVTGGLTGIGLASARALVDAGHHVAVCSRRGATEELAAEARDALGAQVLIGAADVADQSSINQFLEQVRDTFGAPSILVNAAGIYRQGFLHEAEDSAWFDQIEINLSGVYRMIRSVYPEMEQQGWGRIVNIASTAGRVGAAGYAGYCASKAGVIGLSKAVAVEGAPYGINCISISPTWVETPMMDNATARHAKAGKISPKAAKDALTTSNPQGRLVQPSEIGTLVAFFCSEASPALTNEDIQINAGALW